MVPTTAAPPPAATGGGGGPGWDSSSFGARAADVDAAPRGATTPRARRRRPREAPAAHRRASRPRRTHGSLPTVFLPNPVEQRGWTGGGAVGFSQPAGLAVPGLVRQDTPRSAPVIVVSGPGDRHVDVDVRAGARDRRPG
jgi:hypothetical protein